MVFGLKSRNITVSLNGKMNVLGDVTYKGIEHIYADYGNPKPILKFVAKKAAARGLVR